MIEVDWFLPTGGDSRDVLPDAGGHHRPPTQSYLAQIATACDDLGFDAVLTPCGTGCEDAWLATAMLVPLTRRLKFLVAFRPVLLSPTLAAQMASTYQRLSGGRLLINVVTGAEPSELARFGVFEDKDTRYERTAEFLAVVRGAWNSRPFTHQGRFFRVEAAHTRAVPDPLPPVYFGGASAAAERVAAEHVDTYLLWGETPAMASERIARMRALAAGFDRTLRFGIRFHAIARPSNAEAWAVATTMQAAMTPKSIAAARADFATTASVGQRRMASLSETSKHGDPDDLVIHPNVWAGIGLVRGGAGTALVGSYRAVAERIAEYHDLGIDAFILSGYPHLEEAYHVGEGVMPELRALGLLPERHDDSGAPVFSFR